MKQIIIILTILFIVSFSKGQNISYLENNPVWKISYATSSCVTYGEYNYYLSGDTIINNKQYKKVFKAGYESGSMGPEIGCIPYYITYDNSYPYAYIRQENKRFYAINLYHGCKSEVLLFDFGLKQNDYFKYYYGCDTLNYTSARVKSIDSVLIDSVYRKILNYEDMNCGLGGSILKIIEGIGTLQGLLEFCDGEHEGHRLTCYSLNGVQKFPMSGGSCEVIIGINELTTNNEELIMKLSPNPVNSLFVVSYSLFANSNVTLTVYDITGREIRSWKLEAGSWKGENKSTINVADLTTGIYFLKLTTDNASSIAKFIKQ